MSRWHLRELRPVLTLIGVVGVLVAHPAGAAGAGRSSTLRDLPALERSVREVGSLVAEADFQAAIARAEATRRWAEDIPRSPDALRTRARLEVLLATAQIALGDRDGARRSMRQAVYVWPLLSLDERTTSPRVVRLFRAVRGGGRSAGGP